jgi:hypothetical protein
MLLLLLLVQMRRTSFSSQILENLLKLKWERALMLLRASWQNVLRTVQNLWWSAIDAVVLLQLGSLE